MAQIIWTELAEADLRSIFDFISEDSVLYASRQIDKIINKTSILKTHPESGRIVPELNNPLIRELIEGNYRIVYKIISNSKIAIARIHHSAKLLKDI